MHIDVLMRIAGVTSPLHKDIDTYCYISPIRLQQMAQLGHNSVKKNRFYWRFSGTWQKQKTLTEVSIWSFDINLNDRVNKQSICWLYETAQRHVTSV